jgi:rhamnosyltransferase
MNFTVSIVIPVKNEATGIRACLDSWINQTIDVEEIVVIDSGSTDGTVEICKAYPQVKLLEISGEEFNHGTTRNLAMQAVTGELTLMTVGDGKAYDKRVLERMRKHFHEDEVAGVCGLQVVPHDRDKNPVEWFRPCSEPLPKKFVFANANSFNALPPCQKLQAASWDNVIAMYRTHVLRDKIPFRKVTYGEDPLWATEALQSGHALIYDPSCRVYHYHLEDTEVTYKRSITMHFLRHRLFQLQPQPAGSTTRYFLSYAKSLFLNDDLTIKEKFHWMQFTMKNRRAMQCARVDFCLALKQGNDAIEKLHQKCTGKTFKIAA